LGRTGGDDGLSNRMMVALVWGSWERREGEGLGWRNRMKVEGGGGGERG
jgi:hypothetical protein